MLTFNQEHVMINHILNRRKKHLEKLESENSSASTIKTWNDFYSRLLLKYNRSEVSINVS